MSRTIYQFPKFSKLNLVHKSEVSKLTSRFKPYSDFNFTSLFSWNLDNKTEVSLLGSNLVIKMSDYITSRTVYSLLGDTNIDESVERLLGLTDRLELVPEKVVDEITNKSRYRITADRDNYDYIYSLRRLATFGGRQYKWKRKRLKRFESSYSQRAKLQVLDLRDKNTRGEILEVFSSWSKERGKKNKEVIHEKNAIVNLLDNMKGFHLYVLGIKIDNKLVGFSVNEGLSDSYCICHFQKCILSYPNIDIYLSNQTAKAMLDKGYRYINWEQDLGLEGLRRQKMLYSPHRWLKKYTIQAK